MRGSSRRIHNCPLREVCIQQRCIPRVRASAFSRGDHRTRTYVGKHVVNVGVHSSLRIISPLFVLSLLLSLLFLLPLLCFLRVFLFLSRVSTSARPTIRTRRNPLLFFIPHPNPLSWIPWPGTTVSHLRSRGN